MGTLDGEVLILLFGEKHKEQKWICQEIRLLMFIKLALYSLLVGQ